MIAAMSWRDLLPWNKPRPLPREQYLPIEDGDLAVLEQLEQASADLAQPREVVHYLYLPSRSAATVAAENLLLCGFQTQVGLAANAPAEPVHPWLVMATARTVVDREAVARTRRIFEEIAAKLDGTYDGWEASTRP
jgi:hypothetical protein